MMVIFVRSRRIDGRTGQVQGHQHRPRRHFCRADRLLDAAVGCHRPADAKMKSARGRRCHHHHPPDGHLVPSQNAPLVTRRYRLTELLLNYSVVLSDLGQNYFICLVFNSDIFFLSLFSKKCGIGRGYRRLSLKLILNNNNI